jgi:uncharacterized repeat protein (TIGR03803 family)
VFDKAGNLYGTTGQGGYALDVCGTAGGIGCGTVFELSPPEKPGDPWTEKVLHRFIISLDDWYPKAGVTLDKEGRLYGTTTGTIFMMTPSGKDGSWIETILATLNESGGYDPTGNLIFGASGDLYGTASSGGGRGAVFSLAPTGITPSSWEFTDLYDFGNVPDGEQPIGGLAPDGAGNLYGTTVYGGSGSGCSFTGCGTVFEVSP